MTRTVHRAPTAAVAFVLAALVAVAIAATRPATAPAGGDQNIAVAINTRDGSSLFRFAFSIRRVTGEVVDQTNAAVAYSSCVDCQTVAVALQVVLVFSPGAVTPTNLAIALNADCASCATAALAYQYVIGGGGPVRFTAEGNRRIAAIRREFRRLRRSGLSLAEIVARTQELNAELRDILATELVPAGRDDDDNERRRGPVGEEQREARPR